MAPLAAQPVHTAGSNKLYFAISQTADPLGAYYLYTFSTLTLTISRLGLAEWLLRRHERGPRTPPTPLTARKMLAGLPATAVRVSGETNC